jgi:hypothetical protein
MKPRGLALAATLSLLLSSPRALAGPPYFTDDPEPVPHRHWELLLGSQSLHDRDGWTGTAPHFEVNYGVAPDVQLHIIAPVAYAVHARGGWAYGSGDTELGSKIRFVQEGAWLPQIGIYPMLEVPTGKSRLDLGNGTAQAFLPVWLQKSFGAWTTYGGAGFWLDLGRLERRWWFFGWQVQRRLFDGLTLGAEVFHLTPRAAGDESDTRFNVGAVIDLTDAHHLLFSAGRGIGGPNLFQGYIAYLATLGPRD